jgi:hypothetical protein
VAGGGLVDGQPVEQHGGVRAQHRDTGQAHRTRDGRGHQGAQAERLGQVVLAVAAYLAAQEHRREVGTHVIRRRTCSTAVHA